MPVVLDPLKNRPAKLRKATKQKVQLGGRLLWVFSVGWNDSAFCSLFGFDTNCCEVQTEDVSSSFSVIDDHVTHVIPKKCFHYSSEKYIYLNTAEEPTHPNNKTFYQRTRGIAAGGAGRAVAPARPRGPRGPRGETEKYFRDPGLYHTGEGRPSLHEGYVGRPGRPVRVDSWFLKTLQDQLILVM